ncbi:hypothetical protein Dfri01_46520 [Dyadobacter frigoris]|uniref:Pycsar system effector family protein n=1 Tax=Dyadobacter frigoris TaxID=2576211 RepID=UPI0024A0D59A|nr:Pycsar system effector family protein [Dyadobacter frigoris]GLU55191.1 hypothetical protein Dfri01_46520 [Dyadobacter frigoris]
MNYRKLSGKVRKNVIDYFKKNKNPDLAFHTLGHTKRVVSHATKISENYQLSADDFFIVTASAWFHDIGYLSGETIGHENRGAEIAKIFLEEKEVSSEIIQSVSDCIMATSSKNIPQNLLEQIICDADLFHLGTKEFTKQNKLVRKEQEWREGRNITKTEWRNKSITFLESHQFQTDFCRNTLDKRKQKNLEKLRSKITAEPKTEAKALEFSETIIKKKLHEKPLKHQPTSVTRPEKGIETMFRITSGNQQRLSDMADNKAHIMITANSIIISVMLSVLLRKLEDNPELIIPTLILLGVCLSCMVFSILSTRPSTPHGTFTAEDLESKKVNLLFFGNFYKMDFENYLNGMHNMMNDRDFLYDSLIRDVYAQGEVLGKKYRHLKAAYNIFMFGIIASVLAFIVASMIR